MGLIRKLSLSWFIEEWVLMTFLNPFDFNLDLDLDFYLVLVFLLCNTSATSLVYIFQKWKKILLYSLPIDEQFWKNELKFKLINDRFMKAQLLLAENNN